MKLVFGPDNLASHRAPGLDISGDPSDWNAWLTPEALQD